MQRLRVKFSRGSEIKYISHLDLLRLWQRALHRAGIPLAYSEGFSPHPHLSLAAPLPTGNTSECELMDIFCTRQVTPHFFTSAVNQQMPPGIEVIQVQQVSAELPSLQSQVRFAEYKVEVETNKGQPDIESAINNLLSVEKFLWQHTKDGETKTYDLRALVAGLSLNEWHEGYCSLNMKLRSDSMGSGRPEQVTAALGLTQHPRSIHRIKLILE